MRDIDSDDVDELDLVEACPVCDVAGGCYFREGAGDWRCRECGATFDDVVTRKRKIDQPRMLLQALEPEDVSGVGGEQP